MKKNKDVELGGVQEVHQALSSLQAMKVVAKHSGPFTLSRFIYTLNTLSIGWALSQLSREDVAAGPFFTSLQYVLVGIPRGVLLSTGILVGEKNGAKNYNEVGKISRASWQLAALASLISVSSLLISPSIMEELGLITQSVRDVSQSYLNYYSMAVPAILASASEQQIAVATKDPKVPLSFGMTYSGVSAGLGIPFALGMVRPDLSGVKGFGVSTTIASWLGFMGMRLYYKLSSKYEKYDLFRLRYNQDENYLQQLVSLGWKLGLQSGAEFANLMGTSIVISSYAIRTETPSLEMVAPILQISSAWGLVSLGYGQALATLIANERGVMQKALKAGDEKTLVTAKRNINQIGRQGVYLGVGVSALLSGCCWFFSDFFAGAFLHNDLTDEQMKQASHLVQVNAFGLIFDMMRNTYAGNLKGFKDVNFATITSFLFMTIASLAAGSASLSNGGTLAEFTWIRNSSIALSMAMCAVLWHGYASLSPKEQATINTPDDQSGKQVNFFRSAALLFKRGQQESRAQPLLEGNDRATYGRAPQ